MSRLEEARIQHKAMRAAFEHWFSDEGAYVQAVNRNGRGDYVLAQAAFAWMVWQAARGTCNNCREGDRNG